MLHARRCKVNLLPAVRLLVLQTCFRSPNRAALGGEYADNRQASYTLPLSVPCNATGERRRAHVLGAHVPFGRVEAMKGMLCKRRTVALFHSRCDVSW